MASRNHRSGHRSLREYLSRRRDQSHDEAHLVIETHEPQSVIEHPLVYPGEPEMIADDEALIALCAELKAAGVFAYDTEFIGETSYHPRLCLIQVATGGRVVLIDPIQSAIDNRQSPINLAPLWELLADAGVCKIVHAGQPDLTPVVRHLDKPPRNIFDTQIAAGFVGMTYPASLHDLISHYMQVKLPKAMTFTRWDQRPLSAHHLRYAVDDVRYLPAIHDAIVRRLAERGRTTWAAQEFAALEQVERYRFDAETTMQRILKMTHQPHQVRLLLKQYVRIRDRLAENRDLPPRSILKDRTLVDLARAAPTSEEQVLAVSSFPRHLLSGTAERFVKVTEKVMASEAWTEPGKRIKPLSRAQRQQLDAGWLALKELCEREEVALGLAASRKNFGDLAAAALRKKKLPESHALLTGWRQGLVEPVVTGLIAEESRG
ncbi:MAG: HRDC domain-containing protein [Phycisphaeraceae bacterium]